MERIDLGNAANPQEADELEEMTAHEMAVHGYYVVAGIARHEYKQGWKFLTLWDGYGLSEATWEPMSAFMKPDGTINPIFRCYVVENNEGQLLTRAKTLSQRNKKYSSPCAYLLNLPNRTDNVASFRRRWYGAIAPGRMPFSNCQPVNIPTKILEYDDVATPAPAAVYSGKFRRDLASADQCHNG